MQADWRIFSILGIPLYIDSSWLLILVFVTIINANNLSAGQLSALNSVTSWIAGFIMAIVLFISVIFHELGHSLVARNQGIKVNSISLFLFGGVANIESESKTPEEALQVAIAGPIVSILFFVGFSLVKLLFLSTSLWHFLIQDLAKINLFLATFNLIPSLPLDGGQVLKAIIWKITGDRNLGILWSGKAGKLIGCLGILLGIILVIFSGEIGGIWISCIGYFIVQTDCECQELVEVEKYLLNSLAKDVMNREIKTINAKLNLKDFAELYVFETANDLPCLAAVNGCDRDSIFKENLQLIPPDLGSDCSLNHLILPIGEKHLVEEKTSLIEIIKKLETIDDRCIVVISGVGTVAGTIDRVDIVRAIASQYNIFISEAEIDKVKQENTYPDRLQISAIAEGITY